LSKIKKFIIIGLMLFLYFGVHIASYFALGSILADFAFNSQLRELGKNIETNATQDYLEGTNQIFKEELDWYKSVPKQLLNIKANDQINLSAVKIVNLDVTDKWVILMHGYRGSSSQMSNYAKNYFEKGYNILIPDLRAHGLSGGEYITFGWQDRLDLLLWIDEVLKINNNAQIVLHGLSMGASTVMMTTGENLPSNVKVAVSDCGYSGVYDEFYYLATGYLKIGANPAINSLDYFAKKRLGLDIKEASTTTQLNKSTTPTLFIHGEADTFVPFFMLDINFDAAINLIDGETKEKLVVPDAIHGMSAGLDEELYWNTVWNFVCKFVL